MDPTAIERAARNLKKPASLSSSTFSDQPHTRHNRKHGSISTVSFIDEAIDQSHAPLVRYENTFQLQPDKRFPDKKVQSIIYDVLESYLGEEAYDMDLCRQMTKTLSDVIKARVKELLPKRFKIISLVNIGQVKEQTMRMGSRCLWDTNFDSFSSVEFRNRSLFAIAAVYAVYMD